MSHLEQKLDVEIIQPGTIWYNDGSLMEPVLVGPRNGANMCPESAELAAFLTGGNSGIRVIWEHVPGADFYILQWCDNSSFHGPTLRSTIIAAPTNFYDLKFLYDIRIGEEIHWRVMAYSNSGSVSPKSQAWTFKYGCEHDDKKEDPRVKAFGIIIRIIGRREIKCLGMNFFHLIIEYNFEDDAGNLLILLNVDWSIKDSGKNDISFVVENDRFACVRSISTESEVFSLTAEATFFHAGETFKKSETVDITVDCHSCESDILHGTIEENLGCKTYSVKVMEKRFAVMSGTVTPEDLCEMYGTSYCNPIIKSESIGLTIDAAHPWNPGLKQGTEVLLAKTCAPCDDGVTATTDAGGTEDGHTGTADRDEEICPEGFMRCLECEGGFPKDCLPVTAHVTISGLVNGTCPDCDVFNKTHVLTRKGISKCSWSSEPIPFCGAEATITLLYLGTSWILEIAIPVFASVLYISEINSCWDKKLTLTKKETFLDIICAGWPETIDVFIDWPASLEMLDAEEWDLGTGGGGGGAGGGGAGGGNPAKEEIEDCCKDRQYWIIAVIGDPKQVEVVTDVKCKEITTGAGTLTGTGTSIGGGTPGDKIKCMCRSKYNILSEITPPPVLGLNYFIQLDRGEPGIPGVDDCLVSGDLNLFYIGTVLNGITFPGGVWQSPELFEPCFVLGATEAVCHLKFRYYWFSCIGCSDIPKEGDTLPFCEGQFVLGLDIKACTKISPNPTSGDLEKALPNALFQIPAQMGHLADPNPYAGCSPILMIYDSLALGMEIYRVDCPDCDINILEGLSNIIWGGTLTE